MDFEIPSKSATSSRLRKRGVLAAIATVCITGSFRWVFCRGLPGVSRKPPYILHCTYYLVTASVAPRLTPILATKKAELGSLTGVFHNLTFGNLEGGRRWQGAIRGACRLSEPGTRNPEPGLRGQGLSVTRYEFRESGVRNR